MRGRSSRRAELPERLAALDELVASGAGVLDPATEAAARALRARAGERLGHGADRTVVALAGATGSGKSSLFNALAGTVLAEVGVRRPTTSVTRACAWGDGADGLLDWLGVARRHVLAGGGPLDGLVLLDLPDHDSTAAAHRAEVDRVVAVADVVVWVLDPQKYADRAVHEGYLRPLAHHAGVLVVALNQSDRLTEPELAACRADLGRLLADDGLPDVALVATTTLGEGGVEPLRAVLAERVGERRAAADRLAADLDALAEVLGPLCAGGGADPSPGERADVVAALAEAAGVPAVADAVAGSHRARAVAATGWPPLRWLRRVRPDPLRRLHLGQPGGGGGRTSLPAAGPVARARVDAALGALVASAGGGLPLAWADEVGLVVEDRRPGLADQLDRAVASTDLGAADRPRWWRVAGGFQWAAIAVALVGAVWLAALAGLAYLQLDELATPDLGPVPLPTALLLGGVAAGLLVAWASRLLAGVGARRRARRASARLRAAVAAVAEAEVLDPVEAVLARRGRCCDALRRITGGRRR